MKISEKTWSAYVDKMRKISDKAANELKKYVESAGTDDVNALIDVAYAIGSKYGDAAGALACEMYEAIATAQGMTIAPAMPAELPKRSYMAKIINDVRATAPTEISYQVERMVKQSASDTMLSNARRDGAEYAWIPHGDTCAYCLMLASFGWQKAVNRTPRASHVHAHCDCQFAVRFDGASGVSGYDAEFYKRIFSNADGDRNIDKINALRRENYAENAAEINAQKRAEYRARQERNEKQK